MRHLTEISDFSKGEIYTILSVANDIIANEGSFVDRMKGKVMATLFYEPSTRTKFSFESAMHRLGGGVIGFSGTDSTSVSKGESFEDTVRTVACYSDVIVMRHYEQYAPMKAASYSQVPVINAGDGGNQHPTQTLTDLLTINQSMGRLDNLKIVLVGDLKYGRTVHSLVKAMNKYENNKFVFVSPSELKMPDYIKESLDEGSYVETQDLDYGVKEADVLYITRIQRERFEDKNQYEKLKDVYILDNLKMKKAKEEMIILHPLPRVNEIAKEVDADPRAKYFDQVKYGMYVRMALLLKLEELRGE